MTPIEIQKETDLTQFSKEQLREWLKVNNGREGTAEGYVPCQDVSSYLTHLTVVQGRGGKVVKAVVGEKFVFE